MPLGENRGTTTFSKLGVQFLGLGYCTEQNTDGIPMVSCNAVCCVTVITLFIKKVGMVRPNFGGFRTPRPPVVAPLVEKGSLPEQEHDGRKPMEKLENPGSRGNQQIKQRRR